MGRACDQYKESRRRDAGIPPCPRNTATLADFRHFIRNISSNAVYTRGPRAAKTFSSHHDPHMAEFCHF